MLRNRKRSLSAEASHFLGSPSSSQPPDLYPCLNLSFTFCLPPLSAHDGPKLPAFLWTTGAGRLVPADFPRPARACAEPLLARTRCHPPSSTPAIWGMRVRRKPAPAPFVEQRASPGSSDSFSSTRPLSYSSRSRPHWRAPGLKTVTSKKDRGRSYGEGTRARPPRSRGRSPAPRTGFLPSHWPARPSVSARAAPARLPAPGLTTPLDWLPSRLSAAHACPNLS